MKNKKNSYKNSEHFKIPANYFEDLEDEVMIKIITDSFPKETGFSIPDAYFESALTSVTDTLFGPTVKQGDFKIPEDYFNGSHIEDRVFEKIAVEKTAPKVIPLKNFFLNKFAPIAVAASLALIVFFNYDKVDPSLHSLEASEIERWIEQDLISLNTSEILEVFSDVELTNEPIFDDEEIIDYLDNANIESLLFEEE